MILFVWFVVVVVVWVCFIDSNRVHSVLDLSIVVLWTHQWVCTWRQRLLLHQIKEKNRQIVKHRGVGPLFFLSWSMFTIHRPSVDGSSYYAVRTVLFFSCPGHSVLMPFFPCYISLPPTLQCSASLRGSCINVLFKADYSIAPYALYHDQLCSVTLTHIHYKEKLFWLNWRVAFVYGV